MEQLVGRIEERKILENALASSEAELIAIYGRRRIGKTFLIRSVYEKYIKFEFTGVHKATMQEQLENFSFALKKAINSPIDIAIPKNWEAAFHSLENILEPLIKKGKAAIFFDEFPWIHTKKSNFLTAFEHFWNSWASKHDTNDLLFRVFSDVTFSMAVDFELNNRIDKEDCRRQMFSKQQELLTTLDKDWGTRIEKERQWILRTHPFDDFASIRANYSKQLTDTGTESWTAWNEACKKYPLPKSS